MKQGAIHEKQTGLFGQSVLGYQWQRFSDTVILSFSHQKQNNKEYIYKFSCSLAKNLLNDYVFKIKKYRLRYDDNDMLSLFYICSKPI